MFIKLNSDVVINTNYIVEIEPQEKNIVNNNGNRVKYSIYMIDKSCWYATSEDYNKIMAHI